MQTEVKILGKAYSVRSDLDPSFTTDAADFVNLRMRELMTKSGSVATEKVAVLTAMNLAGELLRLQRKQTRLQSELKQKAKKLISFIDTRL